MAEGLLTENVLVGGSEMPGPKTSKETNISHEKFNMVKYLHHLMKKKVSTAMGANMCEHSLPVLLTFH